MGLGLDSSRVIRGHICAVDLQSTLVCASDAKRRAKVSTREGGDGGTNKRALTAETAKSSAGHHTSAISKIWPDRTFPRARRVGA
jgi:hypothetical protein